MGIKLSSGGGASPSSPFSQPSHNYGGDAPPEELTLFQKILKWFRWFLIGVTALYVIFIAIVIWVIEYDAEDHHLSSVMMYMPQYIWLAPLAILTPLCLLLRPILVVIHAVVAAVVIFFFMDYVWAGPQEATGPTFKLMTNNIGENHGKSILPFAEANKPDIIVLQDAGRRGPEYQKMFPEAYLHGYDQFLVISKYPVLNGGVLDMSDAEGRPVAAWFEIDLNGQGIYVFAVHMPTPRAQLNAIKGSGLLGSVAHRVKKGGHAEKVYLESKEFFGHQLELAQKLIDFTNEADKPFVVCGDFNVPTHGKTYHLYKKHWTEAFAASGKGFGWTFPGDTKLVPAWLRLDNIYVSQELRPIHTFAEADRPSQHRSMLATLQLPKR